MKTRSGRSGSGLASTGVLDGVDRALERVGCAGTPWADATLPSDTWGAFKG